MTFKKREKNVFFCIASATPYRTPPSHVPHLTAPLPHMCHILLHPSLPCVTSYYTPLPHAPHLTTPLSLFHVPHLTTPLSLSHVLHLTTPLPPMRPTLAASSLAEFSEKRTSGPSIFLGSVMDARTSATRESGRSASRDGSSWRPRLLPGPSWLSFSRFLGKVSPPQLLSTAAATEGKCYLC